MFDIHVFTYQFKAKKLWEEVANLEKVLEIWRILRNLCKRQLHRSPDTLYRIRIFINVIKWNTQSQADSPINYTRIFKHRWIGKNDNNLGQSHFLLLANFRCFNPLHPLLSGCSCYLLPRSPLSFLFRPHSPPLGSSFPCCLILTACDVTRVSY